jgi:Zn-dependent peptidase ImmA (M78 family)
VPIEKIVEFRFGIDIVPVPGLHSQFDIDSYITSDLKEIRVDEFVYKDRETRYRFSLAHELSHSILHQDVFKELKFSTVLEWKSAVGSIPPEDYSWIEHQAYCLAGLILVPQAKLKIIFNEVVQKAKAAGIDLKARSRDARKTAESHMARKFVVSIDVVQRRLKYDNLWKD